MGKARDAFTLIELMVVAAILTVLVGTSILSLLPRAVLRGAEIERRRSATQELIVLQTRLEADWRSVRKAAGVFCNASVRGIEWSHGAGNIGQVVSYTNLGPGGGLRRTVAIRGNGSSRVIEEATYPGIRLRPVASSGAGGPWGVLVETLATPVHRVLVSWPGVEVSR